MVSAAYIGTVVAFYEYIQRFFIPIRDIGMKYSIIQSTYDEREPMEFDMANPPIPGLKELAGARVGGKRKLVIPADLAFGKEGRPPIVPAYSTLVYDIEVLRVL